jgi:hypothetical protein
MQALNVLKTTAVQRRRHDSIWRGGKQQASAAAGVAASGAPPADLDSAVPAGS